MNAGNKRTEEKKQARSDAVGDKQLKGGGWRCRGGGGVCVWGVWGDGWGVGVVFLSANSGDAQTTVPRQIQRGCTNCKTAGSAVPVTAPNPHPTTSTPPPTQHLTTPSSPHLHPLRLNPRLSNKDIIGRDVPLGGTH